MTTPTDSRRTDSASKGEKLAFRISQILGLLHQGVALDKHRLAEQFQVDVRTIERDLGQRLQGVVERDASGQWRLTAQARSTVPTQYLDEYADLAGTRQLFPDTSRGYLLDQIATPKSQRSTRVQPIPAEDLRSQTADFRQLQAAITARHECRFTYKNKPRQVQPYRLIHRLGVWYLAATEVGKLKNFSVALINDLAVDAEKAFRPDAAHIDYINRKEDVWFTQDVTEVLLRVDAEVAHYFTRRPLLPNQTQYTNSDGSLTVRAQASHPQQVLPVVRYWLPHVRILEPVEWHMDLMQGLRCVIDAWICPIMSKFNSLKS
ncbi:helix-turn-helix transcriptional regulator [Amphibiibacter pelophylacis]|uniref:WYL domain-containing protein n=1 Tax=Amphibiibacter pelophylacis TaxID=1799477 RepID=A0ACC6P3Q9_9BURK